MQFTARKVPGRNIIVTSEMDFMTLDSRLVAIAISTAVSLWDLSRQPWARI